VADNVRVLSGLDVLQQMKRRSAMVLRTFRRLLAARMTGTQDQRDILGDSDPPGFTLPNTC